MQAQQLLVTLCLGAATAAAGANALGESGELLIMRAWSSIQGRLACESQAVRCVFTGNGLIEQGSFQGGALECRHDPTACSLPATGSATAIIAFLAGVACTALLMAAGGALLLWRLQQRSESSFWSGSRAAQAPQQQQQQQQTRGSQHDSCASVTQPAASSTGAVATPAELEVFAAAPNPTWNDVLVPRASVVLCRNSDGSLAKLGKGARWVLICFLAAVAAADVGRQWQRSGPCDARWLVRALRLLCGRL